MKINNLKVDNFRLFDDMKLEQFINVVVTVHRSGMRRTAHSVKKRTA